MRSRASLFVQLWLVGALAIGAPGCVVAEKPEARTVSDTIRKNQVIVRRQSTPQDDRLKIRLRTLDSGDVRVAVMRTRTVATLVVDARILKQTWFAGGSRSGGGGGGGFGGGGMGGGGAAVLGILLGVVLLGALLSSGTEPDPVPAPEGFAGTYWFDAKGHPITRATILRRYPQPRRQGDHDIGWIGD